jgi:hypothetical protein
MRTRLRENAAEEGRVVIEEHNVADSLRVTAIPGFVERGGILQVTGVEGNDGVLGSVSCYRSRLAEDDCLTTYTRSMM